MERGSHWFHVIRGTVNLRQGNSSPCPLSAELLILALPKLPRRNPFPEAERRVCRRLREWRLHLRLHQSVIADFVGVHHANYIADIENARAPLRYWIVY